ncbi:hypothetical protein IFM89_000169 [Coptis chinensis]|uniref:Uncharacterized protein n=1 Tax=Coptis chinensis TaxID=261450 RepID=A0A835H3I7_9MAGN|nr:hypothetical protein IFM89_000169 [Coptis chinensis]
MFIGSKSKYSGIFTSSTSNMGLVIVNRIIDAVLIFALFQKMCSEGAYWGIIGGLYVGLDYGVGIILSAGDWKNAMLRGVLTGALVSAAYNNGKDKVVQNAVTGGAIATAAELLCYLK